MNVCVWLITGGGDASGAAAGEAHHRRADAHTLTGGAPPPFNPVSLRSRLPLLMPITLVVSNRRQAQRRKDLLGTQTTPTHERPPRAQQENFRPYSAPPMPENRLGQSAHKTPTLRGVSQHLTVSSCLWLVDPDGKAGSGRAMVERNAVTQELRRQAGESKALKGTVLGLKEELRDAHRQVRT